MAVRNQEPERSQLQNKTQSVFCESSTHTIKVWSLSIANLRTAIHDLLLLSSFLSVSISFFGVFPLACNLHHHWHHNSFFYTPSNINRQRQQSVTGTAIQKHDLLFLSLSLPYFGGFSILSSPRNTTIRAEERTYPNDDTVGDGRRKFFAMTSPRAASVFFVGSRHFGPSLEPDRRWFLLTAMLASWALRERNILT